MGHILDWYMDIAAKIAAYDFSPALPFLAIAFWGCLAAMIISYILHLILEPRKKHRTLGYQCGLFFSQFAFYAGFWWVLLRWGVLFRFFPLFVLVFSLITICGIIRTVWDFLRFLFRYSPLK